MTSKGGRAIPWVLSVLALIVLIVGLACAALALGSVIGWWGPALTVLVAIGVIALAVRTFSHESGSRLR